MIEWRKVTEAEPIPDHDGQILFYKRHSGLNIGRRGASGAFYFPEGYYTDVDFWTPLNMPVEDGDETIDGKEDRVAEMERRIAALEAAASVVSEAEPQRETGWAVLDEAGRALTEVLFSGGHRRLVSWLGSREDAEALARLLGTGRAALLYKDTLEEVAAK